MNISAFGKNVRRIRTELGLTQAKFAKTLNVGQSYISKLENNVIEPTVNIMFNIMHKFKVAIEELLDGIEWHTQCDLIYYI